MKQIQGAIIFVYVLRCLHPSFWMRVRKNFSEMNDDENMKTEITWNENQENTIQGHTQEIVFDQVIGFEMVQIALLASVQRN